MRSWLGGRHRATWEVMRLQLDLTAQVLAIFLKILA
jgi:hypothetical protein